jgi:glycosyltransferase involved in cell wall biosynthesis
VKILMIAPQPFFSPRGTPFSVYYRTLALTAMGHEVDLATYHVGRDVSIPGVRIHRIGRVPFIDSVKIGPSAAKLVLDLFLFWKSLGMLLRGRYDVVHAHEEAVFFCLAYRWFRPGLKFIYDMHSSLPQQLKNFDFSGNRWLIGLFSRLERWAVRSASAVITICPDLQRTVESLRSRTPSVLIENSLIDLIDFSDAGDELSDALINWERFEGRKLVVYSGTFEPYQGIPLLLESAKRVMERRSDALFVLIGGSPPQIAAMREKARALGLGRSVAFTGNLHPNTVKRFVRRADVLVSPRVKGTNTPLKIYEYLASGKPIVATRLETHTQVLSEKEAVLTDCDPAAFAEGILSVLEEPSRGLGDRARRLYDDAYGQAVYADRLKRVMAQVNA